MEQKKDENSVSQSCDANCACNAKKGLPPGLKVILLFVILLIAGGVLTNSLFRKSHSATEKREVSYSSALSSNSNLSPAQQKQRKDSAENVSAKSVVSLTELVSFASLDTIANQYDGVFVLVENNADDKSASRINEILEATKSLVSRGVKFGTFQLLHSSADLQMVRAQFTPPCVLVLVKGRGMRGVDSMNINQQNLFQAYLAAMQPVSCCPAGSKSVCK
jgi:hypothetical protein